LGGYKNLPEPFTEVRFEPYCQTDTVVLGRRHGTEASLGSFYNLRFGHYFYDSQAALAFGADGEIYFEYSSKQIRPWMPAARISFSRSVAIGVSVPKLKLHRLALLGYRGGDWCGGRHHLVSQTAVWRK
jgi:hypothetical protein